MDRVFPNQCSIGHEVGIARCPFAAEHCAMKDVKFAQPLVDLNPLDLGGLIPDLGTSQMKDAILDFEKSLREQVHARGQFGQVISLESTAQGIAELHVRLG